MRERARTVVVLGCLLAGCAARPLDLPADGAVDQSIRFDFGADLQPRVLCTAGANFIFTIDENGTLSRFNPTTAQFFDAGTVSCNAQPGGEIDSMAIDRDGNAYVYYTSGELFRLFTDSLICTPTAYASPFPPQTLAGMSFAEDSPGSASESLYLALDLQGGTPPMPNVLGKVDLTSFTLTAQTPILGMSEPELTGDDQGNLWGFFPSAWQAEIARIDRNSGELDRQIVLNSLTSAPGGYGMASYAGDFYVFYQALSAASTSVYRVDGNTGVLTTLAADTGREIVGVGAATCAGDSVDLGN